MIFKPLNADMQVIDKREYKCDVCWECEWFNHNDWKCHVQISLGLGCPNIIYIGDPEKWNCVFWREENKNDRP